VVTQNGWQDNLSPRRGDLDGEADGQRPYQVEEAVHGQRLTIEWDLHLATLEFFAGVWRNSHQLGV
jgi:hypothetical protein